jgi:hypothetical protein
MERLHGYKEVWWITCPRLELCFASDYSPDISLHFKTNYFCCDYNELSSAQMVGTNLASRSDGVMSILMVTYQTPLAMSVLLALVQLSKALLGSCVKMKGAPRRRQCQHK